MRSLRFHLVVIAILCGVVSGLGQMPPDMENGFKHWGSYDGSSIDTVNMLNGNQMLHAPLIPGYPQRGALETAVFLLQNSKLWQVSCHNDASGAVVCVWNSSNGGVVLQQAPGLSVQRTSDKNGSGTGTTTFSAFGYSITSPDGSTHQLTPVPGTADPTGEATKFDAIDTTGYHLEMSVPDINGVMSTATVTDRHGDQYVAVFTGTNIQCSPPMPTNHLPSAGGYQPLIDDTPMGDQYCQQQAFAQQVIDGNGNRLSGSTNPYLGLDTLNRPMPFTTGNTTTDYSGCVTSHTMAYAYLLNYNAPDGTVRSAKLCYAYITMQTAFGVSGVYEIQDYPTPHTLQLAELVTIILADGSKWNFDYDGYGHLTFVGMPTGGSITYGWTTIAFPSCDPNGGNVSRAVNSRTLNDNNGHSYTWNYSWGTPANGSMTNTATDAVGNDTVHVFTALDGALGCGFYETRTQYYQGTGSGRQLLKQVDTIYSSATYAIETSVGFDLGSVVPTSIQTTVYPSGKVSLVTKSYDAGSGTNRPIFGNVVTEKEYDWGQGAPGPLLRETDTTYQWQVNSAYLTAHMVDLPASVVVKDGSGNRMAETDYTYDEASYLTAYTGTIPQGTRVAAPHGAIRGNLTTVSKWLNTSSSPVVSHTNWYDTGEVHQTIDPLANTTTHSYDSYYGGAYSTNTCNALNQCVSGTYDFNTGVLTSFTDANAGATGQASGNTPGSSAHTSNYVYDYMFRLTSAQAPPDPAGNRPQTSFTYSAAGTFPLSVQRTHTITATLNDVATNYFDGLGRAYHAQHTTPNGNSTVDTTYDGLSHVVQVTNPYYSTSDPTYGAIQTQYDALGRATQVTKQDGSVSAVAYNYVPIQAAPGDCTKSTDEAGKQRLACADGLGRLIEVHEPGDNFNGTQSQGSLNIGGSMQTYTIPGTNATYATGSVTISGVENSNTTSTRSCAQYNTRGVCVDWELDSSTTYDTGTVTVTVNGQNFTYNYGVGGTIDNVSTIATGLQTSINNNSPYVQVTSVTANLSANPPTATLYLQARSSGSGGNYSVSSSSGYDTADFTAPSFSTSTSGMAGGTNGISPTTVYDSGTVTVTIGSFTASASYSQGGNNTAALVASALAGNGPTGLSRSGSPVTASASGSAITIQYATVGTVGNASVGCSSATGQGTYFSGPSFTCPASTALSGGYNPEGASLDFNYFVTQYNYDALGNLLKVTQQGDPAVTSSSQWRVRTFAYDSLSRLLSAINPESGTINYSYDADGNMLQKISPAPNQTGTATQTISYCYDALNRVTGKAYSATGTTCPLSSPVVTYGYDAGTNGIGHLTSLTDQAGSGSYSFDALGRMAGESRTIAGIQKSLAYTYNLDSSVATLTYPSGAMVTYTPDSAGRMLSAVDSGNNINYVAGATYGPDSGLTGFVSGRSSSFAGITNSFSYNNRLQPINMSALSPSATVFSIGYDFHLGNGDNGNVYGITNYRDTSRNQAFTYDALNRLTSAQNAGTDCTQKTVNNLTEYWGNSYDYDAWGNLLQKTVTKCGAENLSVAALANNQLSGYGYDSAGNMIHDATTGNNYSFDQENRITGAAGYTYTYDADGNRVEKSNGTTGTIYWYMSPGIVAESDLTGTLKSEYVFFDGERVARKDFPGNAVSYYFSDHLKTASVITDSTGTVKEDEDYYPWGGELQFVNNDSNHYKFTSKERDAETGLDYFGARYYANPLGRFLTPDWAGHPTEVPYANFGDPQSLNLYTYVRNIPTSLIDGDGHGWWADFGSGLYESTVGPIAHAVAHPINTVVGVGKAIGHTVAHPIDTAVSIGKGTVAFGKAVIHGDGKAIGNVVGTVVSVAATAGTVKAVSGALKGAEVAEVATTVSKAGTVSRVDEIVNTIDQGGFKVTANAKTATQEANVTITHASEPGVKLNVRAETHPLQQGGQPIRHVNVERVTPRTATQPKTVKNTHITQ